jgi:hypothetical protein
MIIRLGFEGWSVWIVYVLVGIMQLTLIITAFIYMVRDNRKARRADATSATGNSTRRDVSGDERTPLLAKRNLHVEETASPRRVV